MSQKSIVFIVSALLSLFVSATAFAQSGGECGSDADCADGEICEIYATTDCACAPCAPGEECESCDCGGSGDFGACVTPPPTCDTDADCPSHLSCVSGWEDSPSAAPPCTVDPDGNEECAEPEPMPEPEPGPAYCSFVPDQCASDADCADGFACETYAYPACDISCEEGANCDDGCDTPDMTGGECYPQQIECDTDAQCPSDWTCYELTSESCSGSGGTGSDCACAACAPGEDCPPCECDVPEPREEESCETHTEAFCIPGDWEDFVDAQVSGGGHSGSTNGDREESGLFGDDGVFRNDGESGSDNDGSSASSDSCSVTTPGLQSGAGLLGLVFVAGAALMVTRRR